MKAWYNVDKTTWGDGPWVEEPDKAVWVDPSTGLDCMIHRSPVMGALCGYVGVPPGHPLHGRVNVAVDVEVHGGLTYSAACQEDGTEASGICHVPEDGRPHDVWWFGFDCGHFMDYPPAIAARDCELFADSPLTTRELWPGSYKTLDYVMAEVLDLAAQLAGANDPQEKE